MARSDSILSGFLHGIAECLLNSPIKHSFMLANYVDNRRVKSSPKLIACESDRPPGHATQLLPIEPDDRLDLRGLHRRL